ncbi:MULTISPECIES: FtsW/RodA/SpoVE family cell cycle protein [unclassified Butyrivibrio]|uniref:FtsW/RodA/SpoVE family cell cycle protein n=2 Tax=unclassified Butyrivibrio TaxID=2639466 RepID=UPI0003B53A84|nr:FtsW/RodA/SpoVE family cell cycle protein [Butyrivibrio sp. AD3002]
MEAARMAGATRTARSGAFATRGMDRPVSKKKVKKEVYVDYSMVFVVLFLLVFGLVMLYSTSSYEATLKKGDSAYYLKHQLIPTVLGVGVMIVVSRIPYQIYKKFASIAYVLSIVLVLLVKTPMGMTINKASRWIKIGGVSVQPAEAAKLAMIIALATFISKLSRNITNPKAFWIVLCVPLPVCFLVWKVTSNLSSAIIIFCIAFAMLFISTPGYRRFIAISGSVVGAAAGVVFFVKKAGFNSSMNFRFVRILAWLDPEAYVNDKGYQTLQSLYAIGSGGLFGKGLGESMQKLGFIPEAQNDMIFSIICEELGIVGAIAVMLMFVILIYRMMVIAQNAPDMYGALLVIGVMAHISIQVILNIAVVTNTIPNTGITLPFISYGGTAVLFLLTEIGIVFNVARHIDV